MTLEQMVRGIVAEMLAGQGVSRHGVISSVDTANALAKVQWDEDGTTSGWLPFAQVAAGSGWGVYCIHKPGTQVFVHSDMGDMAHGVIGGAVHSTQQPPGQVTPYKATSPIPLVPGEITLISETGSSMRFTSGNVVEMHATTVKIDGDLLVSGEITDLNGIHGTLDLLRTDHNMHGHPSVPALGAEAPPNLVTP